jgi:hypothetical protein
MRKITVMTIGISTTMALAIARGNNLLSPMVTGYKRTRQPQSTPEYFAPVWLAVVVAVIVGLCVSLLNH